MTEPEPKAYLLKKDIVPGVIGAVFGISVYIIMPILPGFKGDPVFYRLLGMILAGYGLYIMKIWPWSQKEIELVPGKVIYRRRDGREEVCGDITATAYYRGRFGKRRVDMVAFRYQDTLKKAPVVRRIAASEIQGDFAPLVEQFHELFGGDMDEDLKKKEKKGK